jgi:hypothetical protein
MRPPEDRDDWVAPVVIASLVVIVLALCTVAVFVTGAIVIRVAHDAAVAAPAPPAVTTPAPETPFPTPTASSFSCVERCLDASSAPLMVPSESLQQTVPFSRRRVSASPHPTTASAEYQADTAAWNADPPDDSDCLFVDSRSPVNPGRNGFDWTSDDPVAILGENVDDSGATTMTQTARFFTSQGFAADQMAWMRRQIDACNAIDPSVEKAPGFAIPSDVTAAGFVADWGDVTIVTYDFQRANVVVRFRVVAQGDLDEEKLRQFLGTWVQTGLEQLPLS